MDIFGQHQQINYVVERDSTCISNFRTMGSCGCEFIRSVSGFECCICKVFLRHDNDIEEHFSSLQHQTIYKIHLQNHSQHQNNMNVITNNVSGSSPGDDFAPDKIDCVNQSSAAANHIKVNPPSMVYEAHQTKENEVSNTEKQRKRTNLNNKVMKLADSVLNKSSEKNVAQNAFTSTKNSVLNDESAMQNLDVQNSLDNVAKDNFVESVSYQNANYPSERSATVNKIGEGRLEEGNVKLVGTIVNNAGLDERMSATELPTMGNYPCEVSKTSLQGEQESTYTTIKIKIKQEEVDDYYDDDDDYGCDDNDNDDEDGIIGGFLEESDNESFSPEEPFDEDYIPDVPIDQESQIARKRCRKRRQTSKYAQQRPPTGSFENKKNQIIDEASDTNSSEKTSTTDVETSLNNDPDKGPQPDKALSHGGQEKVEESEDHDNEDPSNPFTCGTCGKDFARQDYLKKHQTVHSNEKPYPCDYCGKLFKRREHRREHHKTHITNKAWPCDVCGKSFTRPSTLSRHKLTHTGERPFACHICGKGFIAAYSLKEHVGTHSTEKHFSCDICGNSFRCHLKLKSHLMVHTGEKPYACRICGMNFRSPSNRSKHQRTHSVNTPYSCGSCGKRFKHRESLRSHERIHTGLKPFECKFCGKQFIRRDDSRKHERIHTGEKPFPCDVCGKAFNRSYVLLRHKRTHTGEKPYSCDICGKKFTSSTYCQYHRNTHSKYKPFSCGVCNMAFTFPDNLRKHERLHTVDAITVNETQTGEIP